MAAEPSSAPRFMADHMAAGVGRYLRLLGYDAAWDRQVRTQELILRANAEQRIFLTRNTRLAGRYPQPRQLLILADAPPAAQLRQIIAELRLDPAAGLFTHCARCNVPLAPAGADLVRERVPPAAWSPARKYFSCPVCRAVFWRGGHLRRLCRKLGLADPALAG